MVLYKTTRQIEKYDFNEDNFLKFLKTENIADEDIQNITTIDELIEKFGDIQEFSAELDNFLYYNGELIDSHIFYHNNYDKAYEDMEWGIH